MKLSIGMIVKNEEKWLDRCLSAIKPILDNVDSELIITDTGSTDKTVEIAKKYTDKVLYFDWVNDFSAARNTGLEKAHGEWFMMLDADDIFISCDHTINFFNSGEYKKYNSASYISRNLSKDDDGKVGCSDFLVPRMTKRLPETRYEGIVHEYLTTYGPPYKKIDDVAEHYGYLYETEEDKLKKFRRNTELLLKRYETEKDTSPMLYVQLYESYLLIKDSETALKYLNDGIALARKLNSITLAAMYYHKAAYYQTEGSFEDAIAVCDEYFLMDKRIRPGRLYTDAEIYGIKAESLVSLGRDTEAVDSFKNFFDVFKDIANGTLVTYDAYLVSSYMSNEINIMPLFNDFIKCCLNAGKINTADMYLSTYPINKYSFENNKISELVSLIIQVSGKSGIKNIRKYYRLLDNVGKQMLTDELFCRLDGDDEREEAMNALSELSGVSERINAKLEIYKKYSDNSDASSMILDYSGKYGINEDVDLIYISLICQYDISEVLACEGTDIRRCALVCCRNIKNFYDAAENYDPNSVKNTRRAEYAVRFYDCCISVRIMDNEDKTDEEKKQIISKLFKVKGAISGLADVNRKLSEFEKLALQVKRNIKAFISAGNSEAALKALSEYKKINPRDIEITELSDMINSLN